MSRARIAIATANASFVLLMLLSCSEARQETAQNNPMILSEQVDWITKRIDISCHCCSNSFSSRCCLKCGQRLRFGKRPNIPERSDTRHTADLVDNVDDADDLQEELHQQEDLFNWSRQPLTCACCLRQMGTHPDSYNWSCCERCQLGLKGNAKTNKSFRNV